MKKNTVFFRKGTIFKGDFSIDVTVVGYTVHIQFYGGSLEDRVHISNKILLLIKDYGGDNIIYDLLYNPSYVSGKFKLEEAVDYFIKNLKLEFDDVQK